MSYDHIPATLKDSARFCVWAYRVHAGKPTKVPYNPCTGAKARSNDPGTFSTFDEATAALSRHPSEYSGIGVGMFGDLVGVDIDHCIDEAGELTALSQEIVDKLGSYTERSPSGTGIHILCCAPGLTFDKERYYVKNSRIGLEVYPAGITQRYLTLTGDVLVDEEVNLRKDELRELLEKYMRRPTSCAPAPGTEQAETAAGDMTSAVLDDADLIDRMLKSAKGESIARLWAGEWDTDYGSQSEADMAFCNHLAFWTRKDPLWMDRLFRQSGLMRDKWDRAQSGSTYGALTIRRAISDAKEVWEPGYANASSPGVENSLAFLREADILHNQRYRRDDIGAGFLLADYLKPFARPIGKGKSWVIYDGKRWKDDVEESAAEAAAKDISRALSIYAAGLPDESDMKNYMDWARVWAQRNRRTQFIRDAVSVYPVTRSVFDQNPWLLNLNNGTLDLRTQEFREHRPDDMLSQLAPVDYDPSAVCPRWERFVSEVMVPGACEASDRDRDIVAAEKSDFLQRYLGYCLSGDTSAEAFLVMYGPTSRNGKSVCVEAVQSVLGNYSRSMNPESLTLSKLKDGRGPSEDIARLNGVRLASVPEMQQGAKLDASRVKQLTGGDTVNARFLGENSFDFIPQCKLLLHTNHLPQCSDLSVFDSGRALVLPFSRHFEDWEQDKGLKSEFRKPENQSGILNWLIQGFQKYQEHGLTPPESVRIATRDYRQDSDKVARFMEDAMEQVPDGEIRLTLLYAAFEWWCRQNGQYVESSRNFRRLLDRAGVQIVKKRPKHGGENTTMVIGYTVVPEYRQAV